MNLSITTLVFGFFIVISASFMRQVLDFIYATIGKQNTILALGVVFVMVFIVILWRISGLKIATYRKLLFLIVLVLGLYWSWSLKIVAERIHILEYGLLGYLAARDLFKNQINIRSNILIVITIFAFAFMDEGFQYFLPYRVYDLRDIAFNIIGGSWGAALFLVKKQDRMQLFVQK